MYEDVKINLVGDISDIQEKVVKTKQIMKDLQEKSSKDRKLEIQIDLAKLQTQLDTARKKLQILKKQGDTDGQIVAKIDIQNLEKGITSAKAQLKSFNQTAETGTKSMGGFNSALGNTLKLLGGFYVFDKIKDGFVGTFNAASNFESAFAGVKKTINGTEQDFKDLSEQFRQLASGPNSIPVAVEELARIGEIGGQLGVKKKDIIAFTETIARIAESTNLTADEAATDFARIANVMQEPIEKVSNMASAVVEVGNNFATTEREVVDFTSRIAGAGKIAGFTTPELIGISTAFSSVGIEAEAGGTAVQKTILTINDAVARGGKELDKFAGLTGMTAKQFGEVWKKDPVQGFNLFVQALGKSGDAASQVLGDLVGEDVRLQRAFLSVANAGDLLTRAVDSATTAAKVNTAATIESNKRFETTASKLQGIKNDFNDMAIELGNKLLPLVVQAGGFLRDLASDAVRGTDKLGGLVSVIKEIGKVVLAMITALTFVSAVKGIQSFVQAFIVANTTMQAGQVAALGFTGTIKALGTAITTALINPVTIATAAIALFAYSIIDSTQRNLEYNNSLQAVQKTFNELGQQAGTGDIGDKIAEISQKMKDSSAEYEKWSIRVASIRGQLDEASPAMQRLKESQQGVTDGAAQTVEQFTKLGEAYFVNAERTKAIIDANTKLKDGVALTSDELKKLEDVLSKEFSSSLDKTQQAFKKVFDGFVKDSTNGQEAFSKTVEQFQGDFDEMSDHGTSAVKNLLNNMIIEQAKAGDVGRAFTTGFSEGLTKQDVIKVLNNAGVKVTDELIGKWLAESAKAGDAGNSYGYLLAAGVDNQSDNAAIAAKNLVNAVNDAIIGAQETFVKNAKALGSNIVNSLANGIGVSIPTLQKAVGAAGSLLNAIAPGAFSLVNASVKAGGAVIQQLESNVKIYKSFKEQLQKPTSGAPKFSGDSPKKGGGGGKSEAEKQAEKDAKEREKREKEEAKAADDALKDRTKAYVDSTKEYADGLKNIREKSADLRENILKFFDDIIGKIKEAKNVQKELNEELTSFKADAERDFLSGIAQRNVDILNEEKELQKKLADLQSGGSVMTDDERIANEKKIADLREQMTKARKQNNDTEELSLRKQIDEIQKQIKLSDNAGKDAKELEDDRKNINEELLKNSEKRLEVEKTLANLTEEERKAYADILAKSQARDALSDPEKELADYREKIKLKEDEVAAETLKQQNIIDVQEKFLALQKVNDEKAQVDRFKLFQLSGKNLETEREKILQGLFDLGFRNKDINGNEVFVTDEQAQSLLDQGKEARDFELEKQQVERQEQVLFETRKNWIQKATDFHVDSLQTVLDKNNELIGQIRVAQEEMIKLKSLQNSVGAGGSGSGATVDNSKAVTVNQNINNIVDFDAASKSFISKIN